MASAVKNKKWLGYSLYCVLVTLALLYYLFPTQAVEEFIDNRVSRINPAFGFTAEKIGPWIPGGLRITTGKIHFNGATTPSVFKADRMYIGPRLLQFIKGKPGFDLTGTAYKGNMNGWYNSSDEAAKTFESRITFKGFDLVDYEFLADKFDHRIIGKIGGDITYDNDSAGGNGKADLSLTDGQLQFQAPIFGISSVDLQNIDLKMELHNREITLVMAELAGSEVKASMTGTIQLQSDVKLSQLNLKGTLEPLAEFYRKYPEIREILKSMKKRVKRGQYFFAITGTIEEPRFRLL